MKINNTDTFYTPPELAQCLLGYVDSLNIENVVDFCVGKGELLKAAKAKFGDIKCFGTDIDGSIVDEIKNTHKHWNIEICDFTDSQSRINTSILKEDFFDLVLSNPPFTCRGSKINKVEYLSNIFHVSTAMVFLVESLRYLKLGGSLYAIMPASILYSEKDKKLICAISENYDITILEERERQIFKDCTPNIVLIKICRKSACTNDSCANLIYTLPLIYDAKDLNIKLFRGNLSVHEKEKFISKDGLYYVHSTSLRNNSITPETIKVNKPQSVVKGPAILIPRVGKPDITKVCVLQPQEIYALSDCVIAIMSDTYKATDILYKAILAKKNEFISLYKGTGAKYITIERLKNVFNLQ